MPTDPGSPDTRPMNVIEVTNLVKRYGNQTAVDGVSFAVEQGEIFAILGPNGAGKTTTVESISGLRTPDSGTISVLGLDPRRDRDELRRVVGVQLQESELPDQIRVWEAIGPLRLVLRRAPRRRAAADRSRAGRQAHVQVRQALGRPEAAALGRARAHRQPEDRDPRRAHHRPRSAGPARHLAAHRGRPRERRHGDPRDPLHGGGRAPRRSHRRDRRGPPRRPRHARGDRVPRRFRAAPPIPAIGPDRGRAPDRPARGSDASRHGQTIEVAGTGNLVLAVTAVLARNQIVANELRIEQAGLEDAFVALTGRRLAS